MSTIASRVLYAKDPAMNTSWHSFMYGYSVPHTLFRGGTYFWKHHDFTPRLFRSHYGLPSK